MEKVFCNEYLLTAINLIKIEAHEKAPDSLEKIERFCDHIFSRLSEEELKQYREYRTNVTTIKL